MKKSQKKLLVFQIALIILFLLSNFVPSILGEYFKVLVLFILLIFFKFFFGFEKDNHREAKNVTIEILICLLTYFLLYYILGIVVSFAKTSNYLSLNGIIYVILPGIIIIFFEEILRYMILRKSEGSRLLLFTTCVFFIIFDLIRMLNFETLTSTHNIFLLIALTLLPAISRNTFASYVSYKAGYKPVLFYMIVMSNYL